jgi:hypothetical protein
MQPLCHWKQWALIAFATTCLMVGRVAAGDDPAQSEDELRALMQQMEAYQMNTDAGPQHPSPRERSLEADLAVMHDRAVTAEAALEECQAEVATLKKPQ